MVVIVPPGKRIAVWDTCCYVGVLSKCHLRATSQHDGVQPVAIPFPQSAPLVVIEPVAAERGRSSSPGLSVEQLDRTVNLARPYRDGRNRDVRCVVSRTCAAYVEPALWR